jgi:hypothetical protein
MVQQSITMRYLFFDMLFTPSVGSSLTLSEHWAQPKAQCRTAPHVIILSTIICAE